MTKEEKIEWLANATAEQLVEQLRWAVTYMHSADFAIMIQGNEDYALVKAELLKRLG